MLLLTGIFWNLNASDNSSFSAIPHYVHSNTIKIKTTNKPQSVFIKFPAVRDKKDYKVCLYFRPYLYTAIPRGWNNYLRLRLNKKLLAKFTEHGFLRLLRRGDYLHNTTFRGNWPWWRNNAWLVYFNNGKEPLDKRILAPRNEKYDYWMDISDLVNYEKRGADNRIEEAQENILEISNTFVKKLIDPKMKTPDLLVEGLKIAYVPVTQVEKDQKRKIKLFKVSEAAIFKTFKVNNFKVSVSHGGDIVLANAKAKYYLQSQFSYFNKPEMKFNILSSGRVSGCKYWKPQITSNKNKTIINALSTEYQLTREISIQKSFIEITDKITSMAKKDIGLHIIYDIITLDYINPKSCRLAGQPKCSTEADAAANPSLFLKQGNSALGMLAMDNVLRLQMVLRHSGNKLSMGNQHLGLKPGQSYSLKRRIYPMESIAYFDFINRVRRDLNLNKTIPGPFIFEAKAIPPNLKFSIVVAGPWYKYGWGAKYSHDEYMAIMKKKIKSLRKDYPGCKILPRMETDLITFDKRKIKNGSKLPMSSRRTGRYGFILSKEHTRILMADPEVRKYKDSMMFTADNRVIVDNYYPPEPYIDIIVRPAERNFRYKEMLKEMDIMFNELGVDGIYWDQFAPGAPLGRCDSRCSYNRWDGRTVDLDKSGAIKRKYYDFALTGISARKNIIEYILKKGKIMVGNSRPLVDETARLGFRFSEMETDKPEAFILERCKPLTGRMETKGHLSGSPIILGVRPYRFVNKGDDDLRARVLMRGIITALRNGQLYYYYDYKIPLKGKLGGDYNPCNNMYPFTPVELNEGFLIGREKIITCISKTFTFKSPKKPEILYFDQYGRNKKADFNLSRNGEFWKIKLKLDNWNEIAIIKFNN
jgi:hypothetical protein